MKPEGIQRPKILIIGNKPYANLHFNNIIDKFNANIRCGMVLPNNNNGTKFDELALCSHVYQNLISHKLPREEFLNVYNKDWPEEYLIKYYDFLSDHRSMFNEIYWAQHRTPVYNQMLADWGCPYRFTKIPRAGCTVIFENLIKQNKVFIVLFSLIYDEVRASRHTHPKTYPIEGCHSKHDETNMLMWLHEKKLIDATLCMLEDTKAPTLNCKDIQPSEFVLNLLKEEYSDAIEMKGED